MLGDKCKLLAWPDDALIKLGKYSAGHNYVKVLEMEIIRNTVERNSIKKMPLSGQLAAAHYRRNVGADSIIAKIENVLSHNYQ